MHESQSIEQALESNGFSKYLWVTMKTEVQTLIYAAIEDLNRQGALAKPITPTPETALFGSASALDSLALINLIVAVEGRVQEKFGKMITLADDRALSQDVSPFSTVQTLSSYIENLLTENVNA
jgi:acyl carrier protein